jgi:hypothetical protein
MLGTVTPVLEHRDSLPLPSTPTPTPTSSPISVLQMKPRHVPLTFPVPLCLFVRLLQLENPSRNFMKFQFGRGEFY